MKIKIVDEEGLKSVEYHKLIYLNRPTLPAFAEGWQESYEVLPFISKKWTLPEIVVGTNALQTVEPITITNSSTDI